MKRLLPAIAAAALLAAGCSSSGSGAPGRTTSSETTAGVAATAPTVTIKDFGYSGDLTVAPGATVEVVDQDSVAHTLTDKEHMMFDTGTINPGASGQFTAPTAPGKYPFGCTLHPEMSGVLTVSG
jgi:plastocyanin